jgi:hypothetical protein
MEYSDYLRSEAAKYRELAERTHDPVVRREFLDLAETCDESANAPFRPRAINSHECAVRLVPRDVDCRATPCVTSIGRGHGIFAGLVLATMLVPNWNCLR